MVKPWRAFGTLFFLLHQGKVLSLLNAPVVGKWFRHVLRIDGGRSSVGNRKITRILPNAIFWWDGPHQKVEFRTHAKFSKRLYYAFRPLWWALHAWDWAVADRWLPELSFGFSTLTAWPDDEASGDTGTADGITENWLDDPTGGNWADLRDAASGLTPSMASTNREIYALACGSTSGKYKWLLRSLFTFNTSGLTVGAIVSGAVFSLYGYSKSDTISGTPYGNIYGASPAAFDSFAVGDFSCFSDTALCDTAISQASFSTSGYNDWTLNSSGIAAIDLDGITAIGVRNSNWDGANTAPTWGNATQCYAKAYFADQTGTTNDPKLVVTYTTSVATKFLPGVMKHYFIPEFIGR